MHLSGNQEDKLVPLRTLQEGLYTLLHTQLLSTLVMLLSHALTCCVLLLALSIVLTDALS